MEYYVYVLRSVKDGNMYTGQTCNLTKRLREHNTGKVVSTKPRRPLYIIYYETTETRKEAMNRERKLKGYKKFIRKSVLIGTREYKILPDW